MAADAIRGRWVGRELRTGHPWDGLLTASGWYGKQFDNAEAVHPLLFRTPSGRIFPVDPGRLPLSLAHRAPVTAVSAARRCLDLAMPLLRARAPKARLRNVEHRNTITAAMIYDQLSIIDVFRRVDDVTLLGLMDTRGVPRPISSCSSAADHHEQRLGDDHRQRRRGRLGYDQPQRTVRSAR